MGKYTDDGDRVRSRGHEVDYQVSGTFNVRRW